MHNTKLSPTDLIPGKNGHPIEGKLCTTFVRTTNFMLPLARSWLYCKVRPKTRWPRGRLPPFSVLTNTCNAFKIKMYSTSREQGFTLVFPNKIASISPHSYSVCAQEGPRYLDKGHFFKTRKIGDHDQISCFARSFFATSILLSLSWTKVLCNLSNVPWALANLALYSLEAILYMR